MGSFNTPRFGWLAATRRLLAKVAADMRKPDGQFVVAGDGAAICHFIQPLPIRKVPGIGKARPSQRCVSALSAQRE